MGGEGAIISLGTPSTGNLPASAILKKLNFFENIHLFFHKIIQFSYVSRNLPNSVAFCAELVKTLRKKNSRCRTFSIDMVAVQDASFERMIFHQYYKYGANKQAPARKDFPHEGTLEFEGFDMKVPKPLKVYTVFDCTNVPPHNTSEQKKLIGKQKYCFNRNQLQLVFNN